MKRTLTIAVIVALLVSALAGAFLEFAAAASEGQTENTWETRNPMPTARSGLGVVAVNDKIYAIGGASEWDSYVGTNEVYDPATNSWETKQPMPKPKANFGIAVYENKIYCIGGSQSMGYNGPEPKGLNMAYDTQTNMWRTLKAMPTPRNYLCANVVDGKIYLIGGSIKEPENPPFYSVNLNEVYDVATDSWSTMKPIPMAVQRYVSAVVDGKIYIIGGYDPERSPSEVLTQVYNPATDSWSTGASAPNKMGDAAGATTGVYAPKKIYILGGIELFASGGNQVYDPKADSWSTGASMLTARGRLGVAVVNDILYAIGGTGENYLEPPVAVNEKYTPFGYGTMSPTVLISSPQNNQNYTSSSIPLSFTLNKPAESLSYSLDGGEKVAIAGNTTLTSLADGSHNITVYATDGSGNAGASETFTFNVDTIPPNITVLSPEAKAYDATDVALTFRVDETFSQIAYSVDGRDNVTVTGNTTLTGLAGGAHSVTVYAWDEAGNVGASKTIAFSIIDVFQTALVIAIIVTVAAVGIGLVFHFKKRKR